ncbi:uncharacterized protein LOC132293139 isoform X2 [Cornus florida]|nr:uncharacterized protein LOC132293139 isoform X2 [Cornus florida]
MSRMADALGIQGGDSIVRPAFAFYTIAVERNFTRGRRKEQVEAACLYISCRENKRPYLLIEFSDHLRINVYVLGAVFLQLCKLLSLEEHPIVQKPVDPSLFIHKFTARLLGEDNKAVSKTALHIIASMKRDWMQTGRKPSGLCGAAIYIAALSYGLTCSKSDIVRIVHICEATLTKRLIEFENTDSGSLTIEEFHMKAKELERERNTANLPNIGLKVSVTNELLCEHKGSGRPPFAAGLCKSCYDEFIELSGGLEGGSEPPAFQRAEQERMSKGSTEEDTNDSNLVPIPCHFEKRSDISEVISGNLQFSEPESIGTTAEKAAIGNGADNNLHGADGTSGMVFEESESLSDIDDAEVDGYLHNEEEKRYKKIIWEEMNREYLEEQAAKEAAAAAAKEAFQSSSYSCPEDMQAAQELAAAAAAAVAKSRKERQQKRAAEARNAVPAQTAAEATREMLTKKRLSSKINYDVLEKLFDESVAPKKSRTETHLDYDDNFRTISKNEELELEDGYNNGDFGTEDAYEDGEDPEGLHGNYENVGEEYDYGDDYGYDGY